MAAFLLCQSNLAPASTGSSASTFASSAWLAAGFFAGITSLEETCIAAKACSCNMHARVCAMPTAGHLHHVHKSRSHSNVPTGNADNEHGDCKTVVKQATKVQLSLFRLREEQSRFDHLPCTRMLIHYQLSSSAGLKLTNA